MTRYSSTDTSICARDLAPIIAAHHGQFDDTRGLSSIIRFFEAKTRKQVSLATMVLAAVLAGYAVTMSGNAIRMVCMQKPTLEAAQ